MIKVAEWTDQKKLVPLKKRGSHHPIIDFERNRTYVVTTILEEPYIMERKTKLGEKLKDEEKYVGYCKDLADKLAEKLDIQCKLKKKIHEKKKHIIIFIVNSHVLSVFELLFCLNAYRKSIFCDDYYCFFFAINFLLFYFYFYCRYIENSTRWKIWCKKFQRNWRMGRHGRRTSAKGEKICFFLFCLSIHDGQMSEFIRFNFINRLTYQIDF